MRYFRIPLLILLSLHTSAGFSRPKPAAKPKAVAQAKPTAKRPSPPAPDSAAAKPVAIEIRAQARGPLKSFYAGRGFWPLWASSGQLGPEADTLLDDLATARLDGVDPQNYDLDRLKQSVAKARDGKPAAVATAELALSQAFARYVTDIRRPTGVKMIYLDPGLKPKRLKPVAVLRAAAMQTSFKDYVAAMGWMSPQYVRLRQLLATARKAGMADGDQQRIRLNLDRARILPGPWTRHIVVDAASSRLWYYQGGKPQGEMKVVTGMTETQTPMLAGMVRYAILNPYWMVPPDLAQKRVAPKVLAGESLQSLRYEARTDWSASATTIDPTTIDWQAVADGHKKVWLRQLPGGANAMGKVKFMFPNEQGIYLHDTPKKELMAESERHFSNGCVRLEDAPRLGKWLLGKPLPAVKQPEKAIVLARAVPVYLTYFTATATEKGVGFIKDAYGRDGKMKN